MLTYIILCLEMCDNHMSRRQDRQDIDHVALFSDHIGSLFMKEDYSDVMLVVERQKFPAHKVLLAARSEYFRYAFRFKFFPIITCF